MLSMWIDGVTPPTAWEWRGGRWVSGPSWISPFDHPALETWSVTDGRRSFVQVRERKPGIQGSPPQSSQPSSVRAYDEAVSQAHAWSGAHHDIEMTGQSITVSTGSACPAPIYLAAGSRGLSGHWDITCVRNTMTRTDLDPVEIARHLVLTGQYSTRTAWQGISLLTERSTARYHDGKLRLRMPEPARHDEPRELAPDADVVAGYEKLIAAVLADRYYLPEHTAVELSGGMDSSNVAMTLAALHGPVVVSGALIQGGAAGRQQKRRREAMIRHTGFRDIRLRAADFPPLDRRCAPKVALGPHEEIYIAGHSQLLSAWKTHGVMWVAAGVGGDEMLSLPRDPSRPSAPTDLLRWLTPSTIEALKDQESGIPPAPPISDSTLRALACGAPMYLRAGMWPLYPLAAPQMWRFGQWLPSSWRQNKNLTRARLQRLGFDKEVTHPPLRENFHEVLQQALHRFGPGAIRSMLKSGSPLIDGRFVDPDELEAVAARLDRRQATEQDERVAHVLRLHAAVTYIGSPTT